MKLNKIISAIVALAMCMTVIPNLEKLPSASAEDEVYYDYWEDAYFDKLSEIMIDGNYCSKAEYGEGMCSTYAIHDLNSDGIPELFVNFQPITAAYSVLYTFYDSQLIDFE